MDTTSPYQMLSDRDIIFERFVERLSSTGRVMPSVHDSATPGTSQEGQGERRQPSSSTANTGQFEVVPISTDHGTINPATVSDSEDITDVSVLSPQRLMMETGREKVEKSSWMQSTSLVSDTKSGSGNSVDSLSAKSGSTHSTAHGPFLKRRLRRKRTIASLSEISQAAVDLQQKLDETDWDRVTSELPKRQKLQDTEQEGISLPCTSKQPVQTRAVSFTPDVVDEEMKQMSQAGSEGEPSTPFSTFCSTSTCRPFTPPNGTSTPVTNRSPEDANTTQSSTSPPVLNCENHNESLAQKSAEDPDDNSTKDGSDL